MFTLKKKEVFTAEETLTKLPNLKLSETGCPTIDGDGYATDITTIEGSKNLLCEGIDDYGKTYYFRGNVTNNWVKIDDTYWRIVRINGNGTIRLIYNGKTTNTIDEETMAFNGVTKEYNKKPKPNDNAYVGFKYGIAGASSYSETHKNTNPSDIFIALKDFYDGNSAEFPSNYKSVVDGTTGFCNDRTPYQYDGISANSKPDTSNYGKGTTPTYYGSYYRLYQKKQQTFKCPQDNDLFTIQEAEKGNQALNIDGVDIPVGLITVDEVEFAGGFGGTANTTYYLRNHQYYWTMSPANYHSGDAIMFYVFANGSLNVGFVYATLGVRPVINLKASTKFTTGEKGTSGEAGTSTNPFTVKLD